MLKQKCRTTKKHEYCFQLITTMLITKYATYILTAFLYEKDLLENKLASLSESKIMSKTFYTWMVLAVNFTKSKKKARNMFKSFRLKYMSRLVQPKATLLESAKLACAVDH